MENKAFVSNRLKSIQDCCLECMELINSIRCEDDKEDDKMLNKLSEVIAVIGVDAACAMIYLKYNTAQS